MKPDAERIVQDLETAPRKTAVNPGSMEPVQSASLPGATLTDLLDRVLRKGLLIDADLIITLAGVPLLAVKLRAALAGIDLMREYGLLTEGDV